MDEHSYIFPSFTEGELIFFRYIQDYCLGPSRWRMSDWEIGYYQRSYWSKRDIGTYETLIIKQDGLEIRFVGQRPCDTFLTMESALIVQDIL